MSEQLSIYHDLWNRYERLLRTNIRKSLAEFCRESDVSYKRMQYWCNCNGKRVEDLRTQIRPPYSAHSVNGSPGTFIQFLPYTRPEVPGSLRGVKLEFPDGVALTLQECTIESVVSLLTSYGDKTPKVKEV